MTLRKSYLLLQCIETSKTKYPIGSSTLMRAIENKLSDDTMSAILAAFKTAANIPNNHGESPLQNGHQIHLHLSNIYLLFQADLDRLIALNDIGKLPPIKQWNLIL
jgi:hypothetical protein